MPLSLFRDVYEFGSPQQRDRILPQALRGELIGALAITEPDAGSDVQNIRTRATRTGENWVLN
jgi:alkylation response protein AidB-like acyl-CoA dehydrogenase